MEVQPVHRVKHEEQEPSEHQRKFLYLPLEIFRDCTNIRSIIVKYDSRNDGKPLKQIEIKHKIADRHKQMQNLETWKDLHLDELNFIPTATDRVDASIWSMPETERNKVHKKLTDHERQFAYLPLDILKRATNIGELVLPTVAKGKKRWLDFAIGEIHKQMPTKCGRWIRELADLRFVDPIEDDGASNNANENVTTTKTIEKHTEPEPKPSTSTAKPKSKKDASITSIPKEVPKQSTRDIQNPKLNNVVGAEFDDYDQLENEIMQLCEKRKHVTTRKTTQKHTEPEPEPSTSTAMPKGKKDASKTSMPKEVPTRSTRELRNSKGDLSSDRDDTAKKKSKVDVATKKSSTSKVAEGKMSTSNASDQMSQSLTRKTRKRKGDSISDEINLPKKKSNTPASVHQQEKSAPKKVPEIIRSPKKLPNPTTTNKTAEHPSRQAAQQKNDSSRGNEVPAKKNGNSSDQHKTTKTVQSTLAVWAKSSSQKDGGDDLSKLPKRQIVPKPPAPAPAPAPVPQTTQTINSNKTNASAQKGVENATRNEAVIVSSNSPSLNNVVEVETDDYHQLEDELIELDERRECTADNRRRQRDVYSPSDFQREILALSFEDFITKTNIKDLVLKDHRKSNNDKNATLTTAAMHPKLEFYHEYCKRIHEWHKNCMKNLKFKECDCTRNAIVAPSKPNTVDDKSNSSAKKSKKTDKNKEDQISDFQREIMALSYEAFINETNICDIVKKNFQDQFKGTRAMVQKDIDFGLAYYEKLRNQPQHWHKTSMALLKFKNCECKRKKQFLDKSCATAVVETREFCGMADFDSDEIFERNRQQRQLAALSTHAIGKSQIICIANLSSEASDLEQEMNDEEHHEDNDDDNNIPTETQNTTALAITPQSEAETHYSSSQSVATSGNEVSDIFTVAPSQPILSVAAVQMTEFIEELASDQSVTFLTQNPFETEDAIEDVPAAVIEVVLKHETISQPRISSQFEPQQNSTPTGKPSSNRLNKTADSQSQKELQTPSSGSTSTSDVKFELSYHLDDDSDVICLGDKPMEIIDLATDDPSTQELFVQCNDRTLCESLITVQTQSSQVEDANGIATRDELINILSGDSPVIEDSESPQNNSPLRNIANIQPPENQSTTKPPAPIRCATPFVPPRPNSNVKKRKAANNDSLSSIPPPKYNYPALQFVNATANHVQNDANSRDQRSDPLEIDTSQTSPRHTTNYSIEDSSSADETSVVDANGMITDSSAEHANLLNQDNTLFLDINTQFLNRVCPSSNQVIRTCQPITTSKTTNANQNSVSTVVVAGPSTLSRLNDDRTEFLHYIDIKTIQSNLKSVLTPTGERTSCLDVEISLQHQCNANNRIVVKGDALKLIMKLTDKEWAAVKSILTTIGTFRFESKCVDPMDDSLLHRAMYLLFKATSKISNVHIAYGDSDLETARVLYKPNVSIENITSTISPFVLAAMKAKAQEQQQRNHD